MSNADDHPLGHAFEEHRWARTHRGLCAVLGCARPRVDHEPAPQPAPSGDEAKVREIAERWTVPNAIERLALMCAVREAYAAGKASNPRCGGCGQIHGPCSLCPSGFCSAHQPVEGMVENISRELATAVVFIADNCDSDIARALVDDLCGYQAVADLIARRGSEGT